ncbi:MAG TPA: BON domain-containing protein [Actinomycetota bacterium]|nr:BON domain-containing protein [Actinomycetota bacterium]
MRVRTFVLGGLIGAAIAYFYDPVSGAGRRARLRDQTMSEVRRTRERADAKKRHLSNVAQGAMSELRSPGPDNLEPDDATIADRIRSEVFGAADVPKDRLVLTVVDGVAELRGELDSEDDVRRIAERVSFVPGVREVRNQMRVHGSAAPNKSDAIEASDKAKKRRAS